MVELRLMSRQWIVDEHGNIIMGEGRKEILENIDKTGSINQTAKIMKMSYKGVWGKIKATEKYLNEDIVHADRKNGTKLSKTGKELLRKYTELKNRCTNEDNRCFEMVFGKNRGQEGE